MLLSGNKLQVSTCTGTHRSVARQNAVAKTITCGPNGASRQTTVHRLIQEHGALMVPGVHDALSAKALDATGHSAAFVSGYAVSRLVTGSRGVAALILVQTQHTGKQNCFMTT